ncbi:hypothetical protein Zm00014a_029395 [Zea mays]|nr:hypothetical protein ZEAMMB73_Zm00001d015097 [Zea mays]PWZ20815.1 hypothetical protein Zm00014a_029395 [Zea mays]
MLLGVDKRRKGQDGAAMEEEDSGGGDYDTVLKAHARSGGGDYGAVLKARARSGASDGVLHDCLLMYEVVEAPCANKYKNVDVVSTISEFSSSLETASGHWRVDCLLRAERMPFYFAVLDQGARSVSSG